jgi:uncharacterized protein (UPF0333 family)
MSLCMLNAKYWDRAKSRRILGGSMRLLICVMLLIFVIVMASSVEQLSRSADKVIILGSIAAKSITNQTIVVNLTNVTKQTNLTNQTQMNISGLQRSFFQADINESRMETPSQVDFQPALSRYDWSSLGKDNDKHGEYSVP